MRKMRGMLAVSIGLALLSGFVLAQATGQGQAPQPTAEHKKLGAVCARNLRTQQRAKSQCQIMHNPVLGLSPWRDPSSDSFD